MTSHKNVVKCQVTNRFLLKTGPMFVSFRRVTGRRYTTGWIQWHRWRSSRLLFHIPPVIRIPTIPITIGIRVLRVLRVVLVIGLEGGHAGRATRCSGRAGAALRATGLF